MQIDLFGSISFFNHFGYRANVLSTNYEDLQMKNQKGVQNQVVPVMLSSGITAFVNPKNIPMENWTHYHGKTAAGQQVNSLRGQIIGKSLLIQGNKGPTLSVTNDEAEVFAVKFLTDMGYKMQAPAI